MIYEIINKGKGLIDTLFPENLLLITPSTPAPILQNLQSVVDNGGNFILSNIQGSINTDWIYFQKTTPTGSAAFELSDDNTYIQGYLGAIESLIQIQSGAVNIQQSEPTGTTRLIFDTPNSGGTLVRVKVPAKTVAGDYTMATLDDIVDTRPYNTCSLLLSQVGTVAPTFTILENTLGDTFTIIYNGVGSYTLRLNTLSLFTSAKTSILTHSGYSSSSYLGINRGNNTDLLITTKFNGNNADNLLVNTTLEIKVYN